MTAGNQLSDKSEEESEDSVVCSERRLERVITQYAQWQVDMRACCLGGRCVVRCDATNDNSVSELGHRL